MEIQELVEKQRAFFMTGATRSTEYRRAAVRRLRETVEARQDEINAALNQDLNKAPFESYITEIGLFLDEARFQEKNIKRWARPERVHTPLAQFPARSFVCKEPYGVVLIMSPWNYPFMLSMEPLVGALAAGNCVLLKPSAYAPATSQLLADLLEDCFPPEYVSVVQGGRRENQSLLEQKFDYIFFTGGIEVGKLVMEKAAAHLTPVSLELGGKSPCIIDNTADIDVAARRLAFGKVLNAGQTCVAPDYLLVQRDVKEQVVEKLKDNLTGFFGGRPLEAPEYPKIVNEKHFKRLLGLMEGTEILFGGGSGEGLRIEPTLLGSVTGESPCMQEEIFGPLLPVLTFDRLEEAIAFINARPKPLALYLFTRDKSHEKKVLAEVAFGGGCINDTVIHLASHALGFGGVGESGMGNYHGKRSFHTFTHEKSIVKKAFWFDNPARYHPYSEKKFKVARLFMK